MKRFAAMGLVVCLCATTGCRRGSVKDEKTIEVEPGAVKVLTIPAAKKVQVDFTSQNGVPINAVLMSKADADETMKKTEKGGTVEIAGKKMAELIGSASGSLKSSTSEKVELAAVFYGNKKASVTVKITGE